jgi:hydrogenase maturation protease
LNTLVLGVGNTLLGDDGAGILAVRQTAHRWAARWAEQPGASQDVVFRETSAAGLNLLDIILGFDKLIVVDAVLATEEQNGRVFRLGLDQFNLPGDAISLHSCGLEAALKLGKCLDQARTPRDVTIIAIGIQAVETVSEELTPAIEKGVEKAAEMVLEELQSVGSGQTSRTQLAFSRLF